MDTSRRKYGRKDGRKFGREADTHTAVLDTLLDGMAYTPAGDASAEGVCIGAITANSQTVSDGALFVAVKGAKSDGHDYIEAAIANGAAAIVAETLLESVQAAAPEHVVFIVVDNSRATLAYLASAFYGHPASELTMIGITGTNGKTTVSYLIEESLRGFGVRTGVIGTVEYRYTDSQGRLQSRAAPLTTPDPVTLHAMLREMVDAGVTHVIMEASSHALEQERLGPIRFSLGIFTNLSQDHLDYHLTMEDYFAAKSLLFSNHMKPDGTVVVVDQDDPAVQDEHGSGEPPPPQRVVDLCRSLSLKTVVCGDSVDNDFRILDSGGSINGVKFTLADTDGHTYNISSPLIGWFNTKNLYTAFAALVVLGFDADRTAELLGNAAGAPGRIEAVDLAGKPGGQPTVVVDYAHTPDALEKVLTALNKIEHKTLYCLVGCGGNRDKAKRSLMGQIAARLADVVIVTDDNPREEDPAEIRKAVIKGVALGGATIRSAAWLRNRHPWEHGFVEIGNRRAAIDAAVTCAEPGDIVLIAGKGHEHYQEIDNRKRFFNDTLFARQASLSWDLQTVAAAVGGAIIGGDPRTALGNVSTDSRTIGDNDIFVALTGENFDGHDFLDKAVENGAGCLIVSDPERVKRAICCVVVNDTLAALGALARYRLELVRKLNEADQFPVVVGLTGSCGKTTVKEMVASIFECRWPNRDDRPADRVLKTLGNFNNLIGLPLSLLPVSLHHRGLVLEMGMNCPGEIAQLTKIGDPDICCITNVQKAHLEGLGSIEGVAAAKGEMFENSRKDAIHVVNCDDEHTVALSEKFSRQTVTFGTTGKCLGRNPQVWADDIGADANGNLSFTLHIETISRPVTIEAPGLHNASNCCAATAVAHAAGIDLDTIVRGLELFRSTSNRMERLVSPAGLNILNDSYNANPASMASALRTLAELEASARGAVLGDMLELGDAAADLHRGIGSVAAQSDLSFLALVGDFAEQIRQGAVTTGMDPERVRIFTDKNEIVDWIWPHMKAGDLQPGDWVLIKASRGLALDTVVEQIMNQC